MVLWSQEQISGAVEDGLTMNPKMRSLEEEYPPKDQEDVSVQAVRITLYHLSKQSE